LDKFRGLVSILGQQTVLQFSPASIISTKLQNIHSSITDTTQCYQLSVLKPYTKNF